MSAKTATAITSVSCKDMAGVEVALEGTVPTATAADTISVTVPARYIGTGFTVLSARCDVWTTAAAGSRVKANQIVTVTSITESTGAVVLTLGAGASIDTSTQTARVHLVIAPTQS
mgnify:CR=1 FL=1